MADRRDKNSNSYFIIGAVIVILVILAFVFFTAGDETIEPTGPTVTTGTMNGTTTAPAPMAPPVAGQDPYAPPPEQRTTPGQVAPGQPGVGTAPPPPPPQDETVAPQDDIRFAPGEQIDPPFEGEPDDTFNDDTFNDGAN